LWRRNKTLPAPLKIDLSEEEDKNLQEFLIESRREPKSFDLGIMDGQWRR
jgi:hypothetical protein